MRFVWRRAYDRLVPFMLKDHFGGSQGLARVFPYTRPDHKWESDAFLIDEHIISEDSSEVHGLERLAHKYHLSAQYRHAYDHWLIAAAWRRDVMESHDFNDDRHREAIEFVFKNVEYNKALYEWDKGRGGRKGMPKPEEFDLSPKVAAKKRE